MECVKQVQTKDFSPITNFKRLEICGRRFVLTTQVQHVGNSEKGHYVTYFHESDQITVINDSIVSDLKSHFKDYFGYSQIRISTELQKNGDENCCILLYQLDNIRFNSTGDCSSIEPTSSNSESSFRNSYGDILSGFIWEKNSCAVDATFSLLRLIYIYYFNFNQREKFNTDWPDLSEILKVRNELLAEAKKKLITLVYEIPFDENGIAIEKEKPPPTVSKPRISKPPSSSLRGPFDLTGEKSPPPKTKPDTPTYGEYMDLSILQDKVFKTTKINSSVYHSVSAIRKCTNSLCTIHNEPIQIWKQDHNIQLYHAERDTHSYNEHDSTHTIEERIDFLISRYFSQKYQVNCKVCFETGNVDSIDVSIYPNLLILYCGKFKTCDKYVKDDIMFFKMKYKLVAVVYKTPGHFVGKYRHTDNAVFYYDGMNNKGKFKETKETNFVYKGAELLFFSLTN